ncbi:MAG: bifunctional phosphoribosyl-AMP cyclohydrolase/phosphoribosyl-ATP diphosphatase HisIE [Bacteroidales bacterium]|nr:bifunctional phosphoribosyl-AMP cyclohydrolase/phosphoribosyl-ATP diphosphatase HisIE [Bacteroidales bacterium]
MKIDFEKNNGLVPVIVQDATTAKVLMMAYMNEEALSLTKKNKKLTFYSRSRKEIWVKGETSGNYLHLVDIKVDCDGDTLLARAIPDGPACHTGSDTCWHEVNKKDSLEFVSYLENIIEERKDADPDSSYTARLFDKGVKKISQKVGEEAVELILEAMDDRDDLMLEESADLVYHLLVLLHAKGYAFRDVAATLRKRHKI